MASLALTPRGHLLLTVTDDVVPPNGLVRRLAISMPNIAERSSLASRATPKETATITVARP
jgi:hypothetical protein